MARDIVDIARAEIGTKENGTNNTKYTQWWGSNVAWCAIFVSWCANQAGVPTSVIPKVANVDGHRSFFEKQGRFKYKGSYTPKRGDLVVYKNDMSHIGIVESCNGTTMHTIEGNWSNKVSERDVSLTNSNLTGWCVPNYPFLNKSNTGGVGGSSSPASMTSFPTVIIPDNCGTYETYMGWHLITAVSQQLTLKRDSVASGRYAVMEIFGLNNAATIDGRLLIATTQNIGGNFPVAIGDYLDVYFSDGTIWHCIAGDVKNPSDAGWSKWGHDNGKNVVEIIYDNYANLVGNGNRYLKTTKIVKVGSYSEGEYSGYYGDYATDSMYATGYIIGNTFANTVPLTPTSIIGSRVSEFTSQPMNAYVSIYIGDKLLSTEPPKPSIIQQLDVSRVEDNTVSGTVSVFDDNWEEIEYYLSNNFDNVSIEYGYSGTNIKARYNVQVDQYTIDFTYEGVSLVISFISQSAYENLSPVDVNTNTTNPTEAIKTICKDLGWEVRDENFVKTKDVHLDHPFNSAHEYPVKYIKDVIIPQAQTENGEIVQFYTDETEISNGKRLIVPHVRKVSYENAVDQLRTYIYRTGYDTVVKDLTFDIHGVFGGSSVFHTVTGVKTNVFNTETKEIKSLVEDQQSVTTEATGEYSHTASDQSIVPMDAAGSTEEQAKNKLYYYMKNTESRHYTATMTLVGDPNIGIIGDNIRIINMTENGYLHHTSGLYMIIGINDSVSNGEMQTVLKLARNGDINDGVELLDHKRLIK